VTQVARVIDKDHTLLHLDICSRCYIELYNNQLFTVKQEIEVARELHKIVSRIRTLDTYFKNPHGPLPVPNLIGTLATLLKVVIQMLGGKTVSELSGIPEENKSGFM
jgi:hypothetical protein